MENHPLPGVAANGATPGTGPLLVATRLTKTYGAVNALTDASFRVDAGSVLALVGENGAGKSTVSRILSGATEPTSGSITFEGEPFRVRTIAEARERGVACAFQELALVPEWTVAENLVLPDRRGRGMFSLRRAQTASARAARTARHHPHQPVGSRRLAPTRRSSARRDRARDRRSTAPAHPG